MADEARKITLRGNQGDPTEYTIAAGSVIPKFSLMYLSSSPQTMSISSADGQTFVGIAMTESTATDTFTKMSVWTNGIFDIKTKGGGQMVLAQTVKIDGVNLVDVQNETSIVKLGECVGTALETVGAGAYGAVSVRVM